MSLFDRAKRSKHSTRQLLGLNEFSEYGIRTFGKEELVFFLVHPTNISVLSPDSIEAKVRQFTLVLSAVAELELLCMDSSQSYEAMKHNLQFLIAKESQPEVKALLVKDLEFLDEVQTETANAREFVLITRYRNEPQEQIFNSVNRIEKLLRDHGFEVRRAGREEIKRILAISYMQRRAEAELSNVDGEQWLKE